MVVRLLLGQHSQALCPQLLRRTAVTRMEQGDTDRRLATRPCTLAVRVCTRACSQRGS